MTDQRARLAAEGMYRPEFESDACGVGLVAATDGLASRRVVQSAIDALKAVWHRGAVDADGCYWMAGNDGWEIVRFTPDGNIDRRIALPVAKPSMVAFGGDRLDIIYVTSIRPKADLENQPQAGSLFAVQAGATGLPEPRFKWR